MNAQRRKALAAIADRMTDLQSQVSTLISDLQDVIDEEQGYLDAMPESLQEGEKGQKAQAAIDAMTSLLDELTNFTDLDAGDLNTAAE